jgi:hypothetical protein
MPNSAATISPASRLTHAGWCSTCWREPPPAARRGVRPTLRASPALRSLCGWRRSTRRSAAGAERDGGRAAERTRAVGGADARAPRLRDPTAAAGTHAGVRSWSSPHRDRIGPERVIAAADDTRSAAISDRRGAAGRAAPRGWRGPNSKTATMHRHDGVADYNAARSRLDG